MPARSAKPFEPEDPMEIVSVVLPLALDREALTDMARAFVEEYAWMGWDGESILRLFSNPYFAGAHRCFDELGEEGIRALIADVTAELEEGHDA